MAMQSDDRLPPWCVVEAYQKADDYRGWRFRVGFRCQDADVQILDIEAHELFAPGRTPRLHMTKEALLQAIHEQVTVQLAKMALEKE
jgi:hypothetical protein